MAAPSSAAPTVHVARQGAGWRASCTRATGGCGWEATAASRRLIVPLKRMHQELHRLGRNGFNLAHIVAMHGGRFEQFTDERTER